MRDHSSLGGSRSNIIVMRDLPKLFDPVFLCAHRLVDRIPRERVIGLLPLLRRAAGEGLAGHALSEPVGEKNLSSAPRREPPTPGPLAASGPN